MSALAEVPGPVSEARSTFALGLAGLGFDVISLWSTWPDGTCRCRDGPDCEKKPGKHPITPDGHWQETRDPVRIRTLLSAGSEPNYGVFPPTGCFAWDVDGAVGPMLDELAAKLGPLPATYGHATPNGEHRFYRWPARLARPASGNLFGIVTRWPSGDKSRGYVVGPYSQVGERMYRPIGDPHHIAELPDAWALAAGERDREPRPAITDTAIGGRHDELRDAAFYLHKRGLSGLVLRAAIDAMNAALPEPKTPAEVTRAIGNVQRFPVDPPDITLDLAPAAEPAEWPELPAATAYHGVLGDIALAVAPHTEADPVALLGTLLAMFGAACGDGHALYQGSLQRANLSVLLVGATGFAGRKGTALDVARSVFRLAYPDLDALWLVGVASGEAITGHLGRHDGLEGRPDEHRVLIVEPEYGRVLTIMNREGSTLSAVLRNAWDGVPLGHARARDESLVTRHHVASIGHITPVELRQKLTDTDAANGFANRLLFLAVRRSHLIPFPKAPDDLVRDFVRPLHQAILEARVPRAMEMDDGARNRWESFYAELALTPRLGLAGAVTGRHEAQVARLALVYALADRSPVVGVAHLEAAIALADYARRSATWALGDSTGNRHADVLRRMLADGDIGWDDAKRALGLRTAADMAEAVAVLTDAGLAELAAIAPATGGRPRRVLRAKGAKGAKDARGARTENGDSAT